MPYKNVEDQKACQRRWYLRNRDVQLKRARINEAKYRKLSIDYIREYFLTHPCVDCGEKDWIVLEFDHVRGKKIRAVSEILHSGPSLSKIKEEISKCDVRCANCHRRKTIIENKGYRSPFSLTDRASEF